jgi:hypothetical protein
MVSVILLLTAIAFLLAGILSAVRPAPDRLTNQQLPPAEQRRLDARLAQLEEERREMGLSVEER